MSKSKGMSNGNLRLCLAMWFEENLTELASPNIIQFVKNLQAQGLDIDDPKETDLLGTIIGNLIISLEME